MVPEIRGLGDGQHGRREWEIQASSHVMRKIQGTKGTAYIVNDTVTVLDGDRW